MQARVEVVNENGETVMKRVQVTPGRLKILQILPRSSMVPIDVINRVLTKKEVSNVIDVVYRHCGQKDTVIFCDRLMALGFGQACNAGISFGIADLTTPDLKEKYVNEAEAEVKTPES